MAKDKYPDPTKKDKIRKDRPDPPSGWKKCSDCEHWIKGPTTPTCYNCGHAFPPPKGKGKAKAVEQQPETSFSDMLPKLDKVSDFMDKAGGYEDASKAVADMEALLHEVGSLDALKEALNLLKKVSGKGK